MSKKVITQKIRGLPKIRWIPGFKKLNIDFRIPDFQLPYEAPQKYLLATMIVGFIYILAGGIYNLAENPIAMGSTQTALVPVLKTLNDQFLLESFIAAILITIGVSGFYLIRYSTKFSFDFSNSVTLLIVGSMIILVAVIGMTIMYNYKAGIS